MPEDHLLFATMEPRLRATGPPINPDRPRQQGQTSSTAGRGAQDSDESDDELETYSNQIAMQIFTTLVGNTGLLRRR